MKIIRRADPIDAFYFDGDFKALQNWVIATEQEHNTHPPHPILEGHADVVYCSCPTGLLVERQVSGTHVILLPKRSNIVTIGQWVIRTATGEYFPCHPQVFRVLYEVVEPTLQPAPTDTSWLQVGRY